MLASVAEMPFDDADWIFEIKLDGYRAVSEIEKGKVKFYSRNGIDFSSRFPSIYSALQKIKHFKQLSSQKLKIDRQPQDPLQCLTTTYPTSRHPLESPK